MRDSINRLKSKIIERKRQELNKRKRSVTNQIHGLVKEIDKEILGKIFLLVPSERTLVICIIQG